MCFYDQYRFNCGDWKWGHFRQHCIREYRTGETCGMKLVMATLPVAQKCRLCEKLDTKERRRIAELERIKRWEGEGGRMRASIEKSWETVQSLQREMDSIQHERQSRLQRF